MKNYGRMQLSPDVCVSRPVPTHIVTFYILPFSWGCRGSFGSKLLPRNKNSEVLNELWLHLKVSYFLKNHFMHFDCDFSLPWGDCVEKTNESATWFKIALLFYMPFLWINYNCNKYLSPPESRNCRCPSDHHSGERRGYWLLQALYVSGYLHHDQKAPEVKARGLFFPGPTCLWDLDVYCVCLHWSQCCSVFGE